CNGLRGKGPANRLGQRINESGGVPAQVESIPFSFANKKTIAKADLVQIGKRLRISSGREFRGARPQGCNRPISGDIPAPYTLRVTLSCHNHEERLSFASAHWAVSLYHIPSPFPAYYPMKRLYPVH